MHVVKNNHLQPLAPPSWDHLLSGTSNINQPPHRPRICVFRSSIYEEHGFTKLNLNLCGPVCPNRNAGSSIDHFLPHAFEDPRIILPYVQRCEHLASSFADPWKVKSPERPELWVRVSSDPGKEAKSLKSASIDGRWPSRPVVSTAAPLPAPPDGSERTPTGSNRTGAAPPPHLGPSGLQKPP